MIKRTTVTSELRKAFPFIPKPDFSDKRKEHQYIKFYFCDIGQAIDTVQQWLSTNYPNVTIEHIYSPTMFNMFDNTAPKRRSLVLRFPYNEYN